MSRNIIKQYIAYPVLLVAAFVGIQSLMFNYLGVAKEETIVLVAQENTSWRIEQLTAEESVLRREIREMKRELDIRVNDRYLAKDLATSESRLGFVISELTRLRLR